MNSPEASRRARPKAHRSKLLIFFAAALITYIPSVPQAAPVGQPDIARRAKPKGDRAQTRASAPAAGAHVSGAAEPTPASTVTSADTLGDLAGHKIGTVEIRGLKRIEKDAVLGKIGSKPDQTLQSDRVRADVQAIFNMGYFDDISVDAQDAGGKVALAYSLHERPVISRLEFVGNERISTSDLKDVIKVKEWSILDINRVKEDVALIQKHYEDKGFYLAKVSYELKQTKSDEVELSYRINDYDKVQIKQITFLNNKRFTSDQLKGVFQETREGGFLSFLNGSGNFKESSFKTDLQRLTLWYLDHGFVKFRYESPVVTVSDDKRYLFISIYVDEGDAYRVGNYEFSGDLLFPKEDLAKDLILLQGETFSITKRNADIQRLTEKYQDLGYAFVNVVPKMNFHDDTKTLDLDYSFEKGNLVYFGEINVLGNTKTYDKVIRRELKVHEGELYNGTRLRQSRENVERLGYFSPGEVVFNSVTPKGRNDQVNIEIGIKERSTGTITLGAGYGSAQGFFFTTTVSEMNLFGRGQNVSVAAQYAKESNQKSLNVGFTDPYSFDTLWTTGFDLYSVNFLIPNRYLTRRLGLDLKVGYPLAEFTQAYLTYKNEGRQVNNTDPGLPSSPRLNDEVSYDYGVTSSFILSLVRDKRNNRFETTGGSYQSASMEVAGAGGDKRFIKWDLNNRFYHRVVSDLVFRNSTEVGQISGYGGVPIPPAEKFFLGGPNNMKGFDFYTLGPTEPGTITNPTNGAVTNVTVPFGGTFQAFSLFELEYPLIREAGLKIVGFFDVGNSWDHLPSGGEPFTIRADYGFGLRWFSPIGPLRFEWGFPIAAKPGEANPAFQFFIGPPF